MDVKKNSREPNDFSKEQSLFNLTDRLLDPKLKLNSVYKPFLAKYFNFNLYSTPIYTNNFFLNTKYINLLNYHNFNNEVNYEILDESYENIKNFKFLYYLNYQNINLNNLNFFLPVSSTVTLDYFRPDFDENK
jgi:hypothetical protein